MPSSPRSIAFVTLLLCYRLLAAPVSVPLAPRATPAVMTSSVKDVYEAFKAEIVSNGVVSEAEIGALDEVVRKTMTQEQFDKIDAMASAPGMHAAAAADAVYRELEKSGTLKQLHDDVARASEEHVEAQKVKAHRLNYNIKGDPHADNLAIWNTTLSQVVFIITTQIPFMKCTVM